MADISSIIAAIGGSTKVPVQPEGDANVTPLTQLGLDRVGGEPAPVQVSAAQGAGSTSGGLYPGATGAASDGQVLVGGNRPDSSTGPEQRPVLSDTVGR